MLDDDAEELVEAVSRGDYKEAERLLDGGVKINSRNFVSSCCTSSLVILSLLHGDSTGKLL